MKVPADSLIVLDLAGATARVAGKSAAVIAELTEMGFVVDGDQLVRRIRDDADRKEVAMALIRLGGLFVGGRDWSPSELLAFYAEQGLSLPPYRVITWRDPEHFLIAQH